MSVDCAETEQTAIVLFPETQEASEVKLTLRNAGLYEHTQAQHLPSRLFLQGVN